jgi:Uma2 family endonuclease
VVSDSAQKLVSEAEFLQLPESNERIELLDGEVFLPPSPSFRHQQLLRRIVRALEDWAESREPKVTVGMAPLDVRFARGRILQPDAFVIAGTIDPSHEGPIDIVPTLCIEVLSANRAYDRMTKRLVYAEAGVAELWTVEQDGVVDRWYGDRLSQCERHEEQLTSDVLPGFLLPLDALKA